MSTMAHITLNPSSFGTKEEAFAKIDAEINAQLVKLSGLYSTRNTLLPVASLAPEVLSRIFAHTTSETYTMVHITHVSRHWRNIAVNDASLWSNINKDNVHIAALFAKRSRNLGLSIRLRLNDLDDELRALMSESFHRIRDLTLRGFPGTDPILSQEKDADMFEALRLVQTKISSKTILEGDDFPRLNLLELQAANFRCSSFQNLSSLTTLRIQKPFRELPVNELLDLLVVLPRLQSLVLSEIRFSYDGAQLEVVPLTSLVDFQLILVSFDTDPGLEAIVQLLNHLDLPSTTSCSLDLGINDFDYLPTILKDLMSGVTKSFTSQHPIHTVDALISSYSSLSLTMRTSDGQVVISTRQGGGPALCQKVFVKAINHFPFVSVEKVDLRIPVVLFSRGMFSGEVVGNLRGAKELRISDGAAIYLYRDLCGGLADGKNLTKCFPNLEALCWSFDEHNVVLRQDDLLICEDVLQNHVEEAEGTSERDVEAQLARFLQDLSDRLPRPDANQD